MCINLDRYCFCACVLSRLKGYTLICLKNISPDVSSSSTGTQGAVTDSIPALWQEFEFVTSMTKVIKEKQGPTLLPLPDRKEKLEAFEKWLAEYGATYADQVHVHV